MDNATALQAAVRAYQTGNPVLTEEIARQQLLVADDAESWLTLLAMALQVQSRLPEAIAVYADLTKRFPVSGVHWGNLGTALRDAGRVEESEAAYCQAITLEPGNALHFENIGLLLLDSGNAGSARVAFLQAFDIDPGLPQTCIYGALACVQSGDDRNVERLVSGRGAWGNTLSIEDRLTLSNVVLHLGHWQEAETLLLDALDANREKTLVLTRLVALYERLNRMEQARHFASKLPDPATIADARLAKDVADARASLVQRGDDLAGAKVALEQIAEAPELTTQEEVAVMFNLAKVCDRQGDAAEAMRSLQQAHAAQLRLAGVRNLAHADPDTDQLASLTESLTAEQIAQWPAPRTSDSGRPDPVFVVGFPRSGTTLLEQMLDATPDFRSMDERQFLSAVVDRMKDMGLNYPDQLGELSDSQCDDLRSAYWTAVDDTLSLGAGERLIDKNPLNMLLLPMIRRIFPASPIVLALRHPCDVVLSCYMQHFRAPMFIAMCSNLERLATSYVTAMNFWIRHEELLHPKVFHLRHEDLLADFDGVTQRLGDFLGIADTSAMANFHEHARAKSFIGTPSYTQVIEPLNSSSAGRWHKYENYFKSALPILQPIIEHWGYAD